MLALLTELYPWLKALHIIAVIAWMAGMFYLPRLYVYHVTSTVGSEQAETFKVMERRLSKVILTPAMSVAVVVGVVLALIPGIVDWSMGWVWVKLFLLIVMLFTHGALMHWRKAFETDVNQRTARFFRMINEVPPLLMALIVILVVVKPF